MITTPNNSETIKAIDKNNLKFSEIFKNFSGKKFSKPDTNWNIIYWKAPANINNPKKTKKAASRKNNGLSLTGIIKGRTTRKALINGDLYQTGDKVKNMEITEIGQNHVTIKHANKNIKLYLENPRMIKR